MRSARTTRWRSRCTRTSPPTDDRITPDDVPGGCADRVARVVDMTMQEKNGKPKKKTSPERRTIDCLRAHEHRPTGVRARRPAPPDPLGLDPGVHPAPARRGNGPSAVSRGNGEGSVYQRRSDGRWVASWTEQDVDGAVRRQVLDAGSQAEAKRLLRNALNRVALNQPGVDQSIPLGGLRQAVDRDNTRGARHQGVHTARLRRCARALGSPDARN